MSRLNKVVYLLVRKDHKVSTIGSWKQAGNLIDNFNDQKDIGWHIFQALNKGADSVEVVLGDHL